ncbi:hypothetical protein MKK75_21890 [Methylobacterium sp. J-030]|uniref:hypothetical protein n=1 Tax=Methylobacterium sp. J-030 TaxID=2836627 RepID=UPI001FB8FC2E|nr:hypothetical protein [Methylobacterium sp. J-030]MCJ2071415.1 hypothetical protein [Methylobacterium sp. J-030]
MSDQTRDLVVEAADKAGRSMSEEIERRVDQSFQTASLAQSLLNGSENLYVMVSRISSLVSTIENYTDKSGAHLGSKDWKVHEPTRAAIRAGVTQLVDDLTAPVRKVDRDELAEMARTLSANVSGGDKQVSETDRRKIEEYAHLSAIYNLEALSKVFAGILSGTISLEDVNSAFRPTL